MITPEQLAQSGSEDGHQLALFCWCGLNIKDYPLLKWYHAIPNGGSRNKIEAGKMVGMGVRAGVLDTFLPVPVKYVGKYGQQTLYSGLYIELKKPGEQTKKNGGLRDDQIIFMEYAKDIGYAVAVCYSWQHARDALVKYLKLEWDE